MNIWIKKSIELANSSYYLDRLQRDVYKPEIHKTSSTGRSIPTSIRHEIIDAHTERDDVRLIEVLLKLPKFPIDDIYVGFLRESQRGSRKCNSNVIHNNPEVTNRVAERLFSIPISELLAMCGQPKVINRQMGEMLHNWLPSLGYPVVSEGEFLKNDEFCLVDGKRSKIALLKGSGKLMKSIANTKLGCGLDKEPDVLIKIVDRDPPYMLGEGKYITTFGGNQDKSFVDAIDNFLLSTQGDASRFAVLDGVVWLDRNMKICKKIRNVESIALSALLLPEFLESLL